MVTLSTSAPESSPHRPVVLVVDDDPDYLEVLQLFLNELNVEVRAADGGRKALEMAEQSPPDLVVLDVKMPDMSGFDVCRRLRAKEETMLTPVIFSTGLDASADRLLALEVGATDFFTKPVRRDEFLVRVRTALDLQVARRELEAVRIAMEQERTERVRAVFKRYVAPGLVEQILDEQGPAGASVLSQHRRCEAVVAFADLRGFTRMSEILDPGVVVSLLNRFFALVINRVHQHGGTSISMAGDCLMAGFGVPLPQSDGAARAVSAAAEMISDFPQLATGWEQDYGVRTGLGVGIASGEVVAGNVGSPDFMNFTVIGDVVNVASRLKDRARAGEILFTPAVMEALEGHAFGTGSVALGAIPLKGKVEPLDVFCIPTQERVITD